MKAAHWLMFAAALMFGACDDGDSDDGGDNGGGEGGSAAASGFEGGTFKVTTQSVDDGCFDGAMNTIVLPDGTPRDLPAPVVIPDYSALAGATLDIDFNDPFQDVTGVAIEAAGENGLQTTGAGFDQTGVDISGDGGDCLADMKVTAQLVSNGTDGFTGTATLTISAATGADCPAFQQGPPCAVATTLTATMARRPLRWGSSSSRPQL